MTQNLHTANRKNRYDGRAGFYEQARPTYPRNVVDFLRAEKFLAPEMEIADIGCGTGKLARLWLENGYTVYGIEPADAMRAAAEEVFAGYPASRVIEARAEATTLAAASVDLVSAGQSFHWFDYPRAKPEFQRILRPPFKFLTVDNRAPEDSLWRLIQTEMRKYETDTLVRELKKHASADRRADFFAACRMHVLPNHQDVGFDGLLGRVLSLSNKPLPGQDGYEEMVHELQSIFEKHQLNGSVHLAYETQVFYGSL